jgi:hypothetical protein
MSLEKRDFDPLSKENLGDALRPPVVQAAEEILSGADPDGALRWVHVENGIERAIGEVNHLADEAPAGSETSARLHIAWLSLHDALEAFDADRHLEED